MPIKKGPSQRTFAGGEFKRGAKATPRNILQARPRFVSPGAPPDYMGVVPDRLNMGGNDQYGDLVTAEEAFAKAVWSLMEGGAELFVDESEVIRWARANGFLNGAYLTEVMDAMQREGFRAASSTLNDGPYHGVDFGDEQILKSAIAQGPVKIGIDADALPPGAGRNNGWYALKRGDFPTLDHCVGLSGYGRANFLFELLNTALPTQVPPTQEGYLLFTWGTVGFVTHDWLMGCCGEAWVRVPTTPGTGPTPPTPNTLPPWLLALAKVLCSMAPSLPPPYNLIAMAACSLLPPGERPDAKRCQLSPTCR